MGGIGERFEGLFGGLSECASTAPPIHSFVFSLTTRSSRCATIQFYTQGEHDDPELISHVRELIQQLEDAGVKPSLDVEGDADEGEEVGEWEDEDEDEEGGDVEMG